jgi:flagellar biosynthetic protein FliR
VPTANAHLVQLLDHVVPFVLVMVRVASIFFSAPLLTSLMIPVRAKAAVAFMFSAAMYPLIPARFVGPTDPDLVMLLPLVLTEVAIGFAIGLLAALPLACMEIAGLLCGQQMGFGLARIYNPELDTDADLLGQLLFYIAMGVYLSLNGLEAVLTAILDSFVSIPVGGMRVEMVPLDTINAVFTSGIELALRVSTPVTAIVFLLVILFGMLAKTMPQLSPMSLAFTFKIVAGLVVIAGALYAIQHATSLSIHDALARMVHWARSP